MIMIGWLLFLQEPKWNTRAVQSSLAVMTRDPSGLTAKLRIVFVCPRASRTQEDVRASQSRTTPSTAALRE
jgi:hypothetical protein